MGHEDAPGAFTRENRIKLSLLAISPSKKFMLPFILVNLIFGETGRKLYYFHKDSGLEVDFVIRHKCKCTLVEVIAATGNTKSAKTILRHPEKYHVCHALKLGDYNIGLAEQTLMLPLHMAFLLTDV